MYKLRSLEVWKGANDLARAAYRLTLSPPLKGHFGLADQIRRSAISIPANLAEGYGLGTRKQFIRCTRIALGSAYEVQCHLELTLDLELANAERCRELLSDAARVTGMLIGMLKGLGASVPR